MGNEPVIVFTVWQPMLPSDWASPATGVLARMPDARVRQYWDPSHLIAKRMAADARDPQPEPECCEQEGIPWDLAAVYPPNAVWTDRMPPAVFINGPVEVMADDVRAAVDKLLFR